MNKSNLIKILARYFRNNALKEHVELAFLYGSWAAGRQHKGSDVDIAVLFSENAGSEHDIYQSIIDISAELNDIIDEEINIIQLKRDFDKPMLYYNAAVHGVPVYFKDEKLYRNYLLEAVSQMEDFCIFGIHWQLVAARHNLKGVINA